MKNEFTPNSNFKKFHKREISSFVGQNLLYEYSLNLLDEERRKAVEENLNSDKNTQTEFIKISNGIQYADLLSEVVVSDRIVHQIVNRSSQLSKFLNKIKFHQWPLLLKWSLEAFVVVLGMVITLNILPWSKIVHLASEDKSQDTIIAQLDRKRKDIEILAPKPNLTDPGFDDEGIKTKSNSELNKIDQKPEISKSEKAPPANAKTVAPSATTSTTATVAVKNIVENQSPSATTNVVNVTNTTVSDNQNNKQTAGYLYRGQLLITNVEMIAPKITQKIADFGGRKAGEVEIGWKKTNQVYYYHFTIPEAKLDELQQFLKLYSEVKLSREIHPRIMPDGIIRIIFTVEEKTSN